MRPHRPYTLEEYNPIWKETFKEVSEKVKSILGDTAILIEHIGSTSIEGIVAKPQVDILVVVKDLDFVKTKHEEMVKAGFTHHGRGYVNEDDDYFSLNTQEGKRIASIHILQEGDTKIDEYRIFRDYLRTHKDERDLYVQVKRDLYSKYKDSFNDYDNGKHNVITEIRERARAWHDGLKNT